MHLASENWRYLTSDSLVFSSKSNRHKDVIGIGLRLRRPMRLEKIFFRITDIRTDSLLVFFNIYRIGAKQQLLLLHKSAYQQMLYTRTNCYTCLDSITIDPSILTQRLIALMLGDEIPNRDAQITTLSGHRSAYIVKESGWFHLSALKIGSTLGRGVYLREEDKLTKIPLITPAFYIRARKNKQRADILYRSAP